MGSNKEYLAIAAGIFVAIIFGFSFMVTSQALEKIASFHLLGYRFLIAALLLTILNFLEIIKLNYQDKKIYALILLSFFQPVAYFIFETIGIKLTSSSQAGMMVALIPISVTIFAAIFLDEKPNFKQLLFIIFSVLGVLFIVVMSGSLGAEVNILGLFLLLAAVIVAGIYNILSRKSSLTFTSIEITYVMMWIGAIVFNLISTMQHLYQGEILNYFTPLFKKDILIAVLYLGFLSSVGAFFMINYTLSKLEASRAAVFGNLTPVIAVIAGVVFRDENIYWFQYLGGLMILVGVWGSNYYGEYEELTKVK